MDVPGVVIRPARLVDLPEVARIDAEAFGAHAYPAFFFRQMADVFADLLCVAEGPDGLAGYALGALAAGRTEGWILSTAVAGTARRRGVGARLVLDAVERLRRRGAAEVRLTVDRANGPAFRLYERLGFGVAAEEAGYFGPGEARVLMVRLL